MIDMDSRLRAARGFGKNETEPSVAVFEQLWNMFFLFYFFIYLFAASLSFDSFSPKDRGHPDAPPPTVSDGWGGIREAMVEVYGKVPDYSGKGRYPSRKQPQPGWKYLQVVKQRDEKGNFLGTELKAIYGDLEELVELLGKSTAYVERTHLTMRTFSSRLTRKSIAFSKEIGMHKACAAIEDMYYNLIRPHKTLRLKNENGGGRKWNERTPAMAAGLTDHIWTLKELFTTVVIGRQHSTG